MIVVADSSPLNYLIQIQRVSLLSRLYQQVHIPSVVMTELRHPKAPTEVVAWITSPPQWLHIHPDDDSWSEFSELDEGEARAIQLAEALHARLLLIDDRRGRDVAEARGIRTTGTLGVILAAGREGLIDAEEEFQSLLRRTSFRVTPPIQRDFLMRARAMPRPDK